ncbi:MAG: insulinase family protein [Firmicutes bacterium]|nr:insulinase family protein [Bacillota bacterium]
MKEINIDIVNEKLFYEKLDNGLEIYMVPNKKVKNIYATFTTRYGSIHDEFIPIGENKMVKVPLGIAHFLEHKMFEQEDGIDPFNFFSKSGADSNAHTSLKNTTYEFTGPNKFLENLEFLLDFVQHPYLTDENIEKEKGIIEQELKMYMDDPFWSMYDGIRNNIFIKNPTKYPIGGTIESVRKITKKDLLRCYKTFYHPSNMFLVITGNFDPEETIKHIKENQSNKKYEKLTPVKLKEYKEPDKVVKSREVVEKNTDTPKLSYGIKINLEKTGYKDYRRRDMYLNIIFDLAFGITSKFYEEMNSKGYLSSSIDIDKVYTETHLLVNLICETNLPNELIKEIENMINNLSIDECELNIIKNKFISNYINLFDNIVALNDTIVTNIIDYGNFDYNYIDNINSLTINELNNVINRLDLNNTSYYIVKPFGD